MRASSPLKARFILFFVFPLLLQSCYLYRQGLGQLDLSFNQVPLEEAVLSEPDPSRKTLLEEVSMIKAFGESQLKLKPSDNYQGYYATEKQGITFVVTAAKADALERYEWWFPIVGKVPYKGYFLLEDAQELAAQMKEEGFDVWLFPSTAYSSLGWFQDPITTPMLKRGRYGLAQTLLHEMAHATLYIEGQGEFNESLASFVGYQGARIYLLARGGEEALVKAAADREKNRAFRLKINQVQENLREIYSRPIPLGEKLNLKDQQFQMLAQDLVKLYPKTKLADWPFNNARILLYGLYREEAPWITNLWKEAGEDWGRFWELLEDYTRKQGWD